MRVGSWNVNRRVGATAVEQGAFLRSNGIEMVAIQEGNANSLEKLCEAAGFDWFYSGVNLAKDLTLLQFYGKRATAQQMCLSKICIPASLKKQNFGTPIY